MAQKLSLRSLQFYISMRPYMLHNNTYLHVVKDSSINTTNISKPIT